MNRNQKSVNSLKHGITSNTLLRCRKEHCFYYDICYIKEELAEYPYGEVCPIEYAKMQSIKESYEKEFCRANRKQKEIIKDLVIVDLKKMRINNLIAITGIVPGCTGSDLLIAPHVLLRYYSEIASEKIKLYRQAKVLLLSTKSDHPVSG